MIRGATRFLRTIPVVTVAREWRCKVDGEETAEKLEAILDSVKPKLPEGATVQRLVCKADWDYRVFTTVPLDKFVEWKDTSFAPEAEFLDALKGTSGVTVVEAQAYVIDAKN